MREVIAGHYQRRRHVALYGAIATALFFAGSQLLPAGLAQNAWIDLGWVVVDGAVAFACFAASRAMSDRSLRWAWSGFAAAMAAWTVSAAVWAWHHLVLDGIPAFPAASNYLGWVGAVCFLFGVFWYRVGRVSLAMNLRQVADLGLMGASLAGLAVEVLYPRVLATGASAGLVTAGMLSPALGGLALVNGLIGASQRGLGARRGVFGKVLGGIAILSIVSTVYVYGLLGGTYEVWGWIDTAGIIGILLIGWAAFEELWMIGEEPVAEGRGSRVAMQVPIFMTAVWMSVVIVLGAPFGPALWPVRTVVVSVLIVSMMLRVWTNHRIAIELQERVTEEENRRWRLETQLVRAQKLEALGTLAGGVAHDFNNVVAAVTATLYLARRKLSRGADATAELDEAERVMHRATGLIERLLGLAHNRGQRRRSVDVGEIVGQVATLLNKVLPANISLAQEVTPALPEVVVDPIGLEHALLNLGLNARDALRDAGSGGTITFVARAGTDTDEVVIEVADDGPGIPPDVLPRLFEPFFTTKPDGQGTGLGLAMVHAFAGSNGFELSVDSTLGAGARFRLSAHGAQQVAGTAGPAAAAG